MKGKLCTISFMLIIGIVIISNCNGISGNPTADWNTYKNEKRANAIGL